MAAEMSRGLVGIGPSSASSKLTTGSNICGTSPDSDVEANVDGNRRSVWIAGELSRRSIAERGSGFRGVAVSVAHRPADAAISRMQDSISPYAEEVGERGKIHRFFRSSEPLVIRVIRVRTSTAARFVQESTVAKPFGRGFDRHGSPARATLRQLNSMHRLSRENSIGVYSWNTSLPVAADLRF